MSAGGSYSLDSTAQFRQDFRTLSFRAVRKGLTAQLSAAIRNVSARLTNDPEQFGDSLFRYPYLGLTEYRCVDGPVIVHYSVDAARKIVYFRNVRPYPGRWLESVP